MKSKIAFYTLFVSLFSFAQQKELGQSFILSLLQEKDFTKSYGFFGEEIKKNISQDVLVTTVSQLEAQLGPFKSILEIQKEMETYFYYSDFKNTKLDIRITFNKENKIAGFFFTPHKVFTTEKALGTELLIKSGGIDLKGTFLLPETNNLKKLVVFVHGSGPQDRDETVIENKPFKDIAESLYNKGIASYRFDKRTKMYPESFNDNSTIDDEVSNDIVSIVNFFRKDKNYSSYEIIVLGHSLGAYMLPRIAKQVAIDKIILMSANARPLEDLILEQYDYLYSLNPTEEFDKEIKKIKEQVFLLHSTDFNLNTPKERLPLNLSASYWKSLLDYNPLKDIKELIIPVLILQGERDYQVKMKDFELWQNNLKKNTKAHFISYPNLNHLMMAGDKPSTPNEYMQKGTVSEKVIQDIIEFISK